MPDSGGKGFVQGIEPYIGSISNMVSNYFLKNKDTQDAFNEWKKRQDYEQQLKTQAEIAKMKQTADALNKYIQGGETQTQLTPTYNPNDVLNTNKTLTPNLENKTSFVPYNTQDLITKGLLAGLTANEIQNKINPKPVDKYDAFKEDPYKQLGRNKFTGQYEVTKDFGTKLNPAYEPKYIEAPINPDGVFDKKTGKIRIDYGGYDPKTGMWQQDANGTLIRRPQFIAITEKDKNGDKVLSTDLNKIYASKFKTQQNMLAQYNSIKNLPTNSEGIVVDNNGKPVMMSTPVYDADGNLLKNITEPINVKSLKRNLDEFNTQYSKYVKNISSEEFNSWYRDLYNFVGGNKQKGNASPLDYYTNLIRAYKTGKLKENDFQNGINLFRATYNFDPLMKYGVVE